MQTRLQGQLAEDKACDYLQKQGLKCVLRNYQCKMGEIDLIMQDQQDIIFVEVRHRSYEQFGSALESVTYFKQQKLIKTALHYLHRYNLTEKVACRFDVVALDDSKITWIQDAFQMD